MKKIFHSVLAGLSIAISGCGTIGHNEQFRIIDISNSIEEHNNLHDGNEMQQYPDYTLANVYDRDYKQNPPIRKGDPVNVIINNVWINDNDEGLLEISQQAEIGVVATVYDGGSDDGRDFLVAYEKGIDDKVLLPINDLLAYSTTSYDEQAIRITVTIFEFDQQENKLLSTLLSKAASAASADATKIATNTISSEVGELLINSNTDDIIAKMTFQVYPWGEGDLTDKRMHRGVPKISTGSYLVVTAENQDEIEHLNKLKEERKIYLNRALKPVIATKTGSAIKKEPLDLTHMVFTIESTSMNKAQEILNKVDSINRSAADLKKSGSLTSSEAELILSNIKSIESSIRLYKAIELQHEKQEIPESLTILWKAGQASGDEKLSLSDSIELKHRMKSLIPPEILSSPECDDVLSSQCKAEFLERVNELTFNPQKASYQFNDKTPNHQTEQVASKNTVKNSRKK